MDFSKYIGRSYETYDCFALVREFYADHFGLSLHNYFDGSSGISKKEVQTLISANKGHFTEVRGKPKLGDIVVIKLFGIECHIGVCVSDKMFLHSIKGVGSAMEKLSRYSRLIAGYYRHGELND
jgi:hypothetical protein